VSGYCRECGEVLSDFRISLGVDICPRCVAVQKVRARKPFWRRWSGR
jgi:phage FluMu protein Com